MLVSPGVVADRVRVEGKRFALAAERWYARGLTYGPFAPRADGHFLPERPRLLSDFAHMRRLGANAIRLYHIPPVELLDDALDHGLRVMIDVPWQKHRCFFEDWTAQADARRKVRTAARDLGDHPAVFAVSVANEIPHDVVRFYGARRVGRFIDDLLAVAKDEAPDCLVTYTNYPSTEFLAPARLDFYSANVYLADADTLGRYLDRLQHVADALPLLLGECGVDAIRHTPTGQADELARQVRSAGRRGLAGTFVFSYTDEWFAGGQQVEGWAFGVTDAGRAERPAAAALAAAWAESPEIVTAADAPPPPRVSVVVCSYNGAATLDECLRSLGRLDYPDYEVILVDDGSTDETPQIAARFPAVRCIRQPNRGLSAARNAGLHAATGQIVAYTDADCVADPTWLTYLVRAMYDQRADAIGGPNVPPAADNWVAKCVAASPGGPSHVMLDDQRAEHVPGCNMAFDRDRLLAAGGFDEQFRQAGDDVDVCWRFLDAGLRIGYAPAALVWHHRRGTVRAYLRQQAGYGRSEAMVLFKHPHRCNAVGGAQWQGVIYGDGAVGLPVAPPMVYHGRFGAGPFQIIYRQNRYSAWAYFTLLEWHLLAAFALTLAPAYAPLAVVAIAMWCLSLAAAVRSAVVAPLPGGAPWWCRPLVVIMHLAQPVVRGWHRHRWCLSHKRLPRAAAVIPPAAVPAPKRIGGGGIDLYWQSHAGRGREHLLAALADRWRADGCPGDFDAEWHDHDVELWPDVWHDARLRTATEELGGPKRFTRVRCVLRLTAFARIAAAVGVAWLGAGLLARTPGLIGAGVVVVVAVAVATLASRRRCRRLLSGVIGSAGLAAGLEPVAASAASGGAAAACEPACRPGPLTAAEPGKTGVATC